MKLFIIITTIFIYFIVNFVVGQKYELPLEKKLFDDEYPTPIPINYYELEEEQKQKQEYLPIESRSFDSNLNQNSIFDSILNPFRNTINRLFSSSNGNNNFKNRIDSIRMRTFKMFLNIYNKSYPPEELQHRAELFFQRRKFIDESIKLYEEGKTMFSLRENTFVDWEDEELKKLTGISIPNYDELNNEIIDNSSSTIVSANNNSLENDDPLLLVGAQIPSSQDWRDTNCISTPINQMKCGACYAISTMSVIETMRCLNKNSSPTLSPQQIVDCSTPDVGYQNFGCQGGWPTRVFKYLQDYNIVSRDSCYPFVRRQNNCRLEQVQSQPGCTLMASPFNRNRIQYKVLNNERDILYHVANTGPVVTVMKASSKFLYYGRGIFDDPSCSRRRDDVDHAIVIVGFGRENGIDYWLIKNSWGTTTWGQGGFGKYKRGSNACSIGHWGWVVTG